MKAPDFDYYRPTSLDEALAVLADPTVDTQLLAGGQSLLPMMHLRLAQPELLLDLNKIEELDFIREQAGSVEIGSMTRYATLAQSSVIDLQLPLIARALPSIAHAAIRNRGTIGGSAALADPAAEMPALLLALDATINLSSQQGARSLSASDFFIGLYETAINEDEVIVSISIPKADANSWFGFYEITRRHGDYAMAGVAVAAGGKSPLTHLRIVFFGVADKPLRAIECEQRLEGIDTEDTQALDDALQAAAQTLDQLELLDDPTTSAATRLQLSRVALRRAFIQQSPPEDLHR